MSRLVDEMKTASLTLETVRSRLSDLYREHKQHLDNPWPFRAIAMLSALLPILSWEDAAREIADANLLNLDALIRIANSRNSAVGCVNAALRNYLASHPGLTEDSQGMIVFVEGSEIRARDEFGFVTMPWILDEGMVATCTKPSTNQGNDEHGEIQG